MLVKVLAFSSLFLSILVCSAVGQDDLARDTGLPDRIGGPKCSNLPTGRDAALQGSVTVAGMAANSSPPKMEIVVYGGGIPAGRKQLKNGGSFSFYCLPRDSVTVSIWIDGAEVQSFPLGMLQAPPFTNRQDFTVTWTSPVATAPPAVVTVDAIYKRSDKDQGLFNRAADEAGRQHTDQAIKLLEDILKNDSGDFVAASALGSLYFLKEDFQRSSEAYSTSLAANDKYQPAIVGKGRSLIMLHDFDGAVEVLTKGLTLAPDSADINHYLGEAYLQNKKGSLAIVYMNKAMQLEPVKKAALHLRLAALYKAAGANDRAANEYRLFLQAVPNYPQRTDLEKFIAENPAQS